MDSRKEVESLTVRTKFEKTIQKVVLGLMDGGNIPNIEMPVSENLKDELVKFAEYHGIDVQEPKNKADYVEAIESFLEINS